MKHHLFLFCILSSILMTHRGWCGPKPLLPIWEHVQNVNTPESVYYDADSETIFVSNIAGNPDQKDGNGWINRLSLDGTVIAAPWVTGLNAPKGIRVFKGSLWVSDINEVVQIEVSTGKILKKFSIPKAIFLNDVAIDKTGNVYVSDTFGSSIYKIPHDAKTDADVMTWMTGKELDDPNGLLIHGNKLIVATWGIAKPDFSTEVPGKLIEIDLNSKKVRAIIKKPFGNLDGLELQKNGRFLVTDWMAGKVYSVSPNGSTTLLLEGIKGAADIGYIAKSKTILLPKMGENKVSAYQLK